MINRWAKLDRSDRPFVAILIVGAIGCFISAAIWHDIDNVIIGILLLAVIRFQIACVTYQKACADHQSTTSTQAEQIASLLLENSDNARKLAAYQGRFGLIVHHEAKFAHMPRIAAKPIPVPEGHPEYQAGHR